jgi:hypothetical protein
VTNIIEIVVKGTNALKPVFDEAKRDAKSYGQQAGDEFGKSAGDQAATTTTQRLRDARGRFVAAGKDSGEGFTEGFEDDAGQRLGEQLAARNKASMRKGGDQAGFDFTDAFGGRVRQDLPDKVEKPLEDSGRKGGQKAGEGAAAAISPLLIGAFAAAATAGPGLILSATAGAVLGAGAMITKGNADLQSSYQQLGRDASDMIETATAPLVPSLQGAVEVLDQGLGHAGRELQSVFAAVAPDAQDLARGLLSLVDNALPGLASGLQAIAPFTSEIAADFGKLGAGISGLFSGLGSGALGGTAGFSALIDLASHLLTDIGQIVGALSNGLGPALHDIDTVAVPVAGALTDVIKAFPPGAIRLAADAVAALFAAFQIAKISGAVQEGATFLTFLKGTTVAATEADGALAGMAAKGVGGLSTALSAAAGPLGVIITGAGMLGNYLGHLAGVGSTVGQSVGDLAIQMENAAQGSGAAQDSVTSLAQALASAPFGAGAKGLGEVDAALMQLQASDPQGAATEFYQIQQALEAQGKSAADVAKMFPQYTKAVQDAQLQAEATAGSSKALTGSIDVLTVSMGDATLKAQENARQSAAATLAALGLSDGSSTLATSLDITLQAFSENSSAASALQQAYDALFGKYASYSDAQAKFTVDLANVAKQVTGGKDAVDLSSEAGAKNFEVFKQLADANESRAEALLRETGSQDKANQSLQDGALALDAAAKKAGFTKDQIDQLNLALYGTKNLSNLSITVGADTDPAINSVNDSLRYIDNQVAYVQVQAVGSIAGGKQLLAHGGEVSSVGAAAAGGVHGSLTMINEQGPELVRLPTGSTVFTNPDSQRMLNQALATAGGGPGALQLEWVGAPDPALDALWTALRAHIRVRGGTGPTSVQTALGQG